MMSFPLLFTNFTVVSNKLLNTVSHPGQCNNFTYIICAPFHKITDFLGSTASLFRITMSTLQSTLKATASSIGEDHLINLRSGRLDIGLS